MMEDVHRCCSLVDEIGEFVAATVRRNEVREVDGYSKVLAAFGNAILEMIEEGK